jgi:DNA-binding MarR family transcriptional regulator
VSIFTKLSALRAFEKRHMRALRTIEDFELVHAIGYHQELGQPMTMKQVYLLGVASVATVQRRLRRLRQHGLVHQIRSKDDGRALELCLSPKLVKLYSKYAELLGS